MFPLPQAGPVIAAPPVRQVSVSCCGYISWQGIPQPWECPGCHRIHREHIPPEPAADEAG